MLTEISISNLGVIPRAFAELSPGLTVLTGETGAGKTMVVTGLRLLTGGRADASRVRAGAKQAVVEGVFSLEGSGEAELERIEKIAEDAGASADENGEYVVARSVSAAGRSRAHLGGRFVPAAALSEFTSSLLTIHGQNDQIRLMSADQQLAALDRYEPAAAEALHAYQQVWRQWREATRDLQERTQKRRELAQEIDRLRFAIAEIDAVDPQEGEDAALVDSINRLQDVDSLRQAAELALVCIDGADAAEGVGSDEEAASSLVGRAASGLISASDDRLKQLGAQLEEVAGVLADVSAELGSYIADLPSETEALDIKLQRQQEIKGLTRKYAPDVAGVLAWRAKAHKRLSKIDTSAEAVEELKKRVGELEKQLVARAATLTKVRTTAAQALGEAVTEELRGLSMPKARLTVNVDKQPYSRAGADAVEIRLAANDAMEPQPLAISASGGELSRVMLALEVILSSGSSGATLVFDEVDAGVGGRAAVQIGRRLARLATNNQVIVVTHLPQVAAYADTHLHVAKSVGDETVSSGVSHLTQPQRVEELARMLAGMEDSETGRAHATELYEQAQKEVQGFKGL
ncbi:DNA repair protein RecN [Corynebacterium mayonis]|uniref:DNA repair protein RecN n=1 Tax=Corynebacterium mayonis TaxID=3062461 RepID=UPI003140C501